jgi:hypothetical protein
MLRTFLVTTFLSCSLAFAVPAGAAELVPLHATFASHVDFGGSFSCPAGQFPLTITGTGTVSHLGRTTQYQEQCVNPADGSSTGRYWFTAANGDTIFGHYHAVNVTQPNPVAEFTGVWFIDGGTGLFAGASGGGSAHGEQNVVTGNAVLILDGSITRVGG